MRLLTISLFVFGTATIALAQERPAPRPEKPGLDRLFRGLDANGDGKVDREEFEKAFPEVMARMREGRGPEAGRAEGGRPESRRPEGPPKKEGSERLERVVEKDVRNAVERKEPELAEHINRLVEKDVRELVERRMPEMMRRIEQLVDRKVREALEGKGGKRPEGRKTLRAERRESGPDGLRTLGPRRERGARADIPEFGPPLGKDGRGGRDGEMRRPARHGDGCMCPQCMRPWERMGRPWGPPSRERSFRGEMRKPPCESDGCKYPGRPLREGMDRPWGPRQRDWDDGPRWRSGPGEERGWRDDRGD